MRYKAIPGLVQHGAPAIRKRYKCKKLGSNTVLMKPALTHNTITADVLKGATKLLRRRQPEVADFLRLNVNRDQLLAQLEEWVEDAGGSSIPITNYHGTIRVPTDPGPISSTSN